MSAPTPFLFLSVRSWAQDEADPASGDNAKTNTPLKLRGNSIWPSRSAAIFGWKTTATPVRTSISFVPLSVWQGDSFQRLRPQGGINAHTSARDKGFI